MELTYYRNRNVKGLVRSMTYNALKHEYYYIDVKYLASLPQVSSVNTSVEESLINVLEVKR